MRWIILLLAVALLPSCQQNTGETTTAMIDIQGHRGARGYYPENTIQGMLMAMDMGVTTLEMDVVITADDQVVVSHEPWMSATICLDSSGQELADAPEWYNIYRMSYAEVQQYDCGSKPHPRFPLQQSAPEQKPLLRELLTATEAYAVAKQLPPPRYNIEIKSKPEGDDLFHPGPAEFARLVLRVIDEMGLIRRTCIQSFDMRPLEYVRLYAPAIHIAQLVEDRQPFSTYGNMLSFTPQVFSPNYALVTPEMVDWCHSRGMQLIPWTVNDTTAIRRLIDMGVDGIITDFPDLVPQALSL